MESGFRKAANLGDLLCFLTDSLHLFSPRGAYSDCVSCKDPVPAAPRPPGLLCERFLSRTCWSQVVLEQPWRGGWGDLHRPDPEWRLDLPDRGDTWNSSSEVYTCQMDHPSQMSPLPVEWSEKLSYLINSSLTKEGAWFTLECQVSPLPAAYFHLLYFPLSFSLGY